MDVLSDTLRVVRLTGAVFLNAILPAPWSLESSTGAEFAQYLNLPSDCIALFHIVVRGHGWFTVRGHAPVEVNAGDAVILPHSSPHVMASMLNLPTIPMSSLLPPLPPGEILTVAGNGSGEATQFVCGFLHCDLRFNPLLGALPELIVVRPRDDGAEAETSQRNAAAASTIMPVRKSDWLATTMHHTVEEALSGRPGNSDMLPRLSEILFFEVVRQYMQWLPAAHPGWLAGIRDPIVGQVLRLVHAHPEDSWTVESLAQAVAVSRSTLAERFTALIGEAPISYLADWRMQLAKHLLKHTDFTLSEVAQRVGYESDEAFNRAFKRHIGQPPAAWRATGALQ
jgi:AraC family transcriptional regulator, alkane utilization regulator